MTPNEIKEKVNALYDEIEAALGNGTFVLNPRIAEIYNEIDKLEQECLHEFDESGQCIYCYSLKEEQQ